MPSSRVAVETKMSSISANVSTTSTNRATDLSTPGLKRPPHDPAPGAVDRANPRRQKSRRRRCNAHPTLASEHHGISWFYTSGHSAGSRLTAKIDEDVGSALQSIENVLTRPSDAVLIRTINLETCKWPCLFISEPYARMFDGASLSRKAAKAL